MALGSDEFESGLFIGIALLAGCRGQVGTRAGFRKDVTDEVHGAAENLPGVVIEGGYMVAVLQHGQLQRRLGQAAAERRDARVARITQS